MLQSYSHQESMVLAETQKYRPMDHNREPETEPQEYAHLIFYKGEKQ